LFAEVELLLPDICPIAECGFILVVFHLGVHQSYSRSGGQDVGCLLFFLFVIQDGLSALRCCRVHHHRPILRLSQLQKNVDKMYAGESVQEVPLSEVV